MWHDVALADQDALHLYIVIHFGLASTRNHGMMARSPRLKGGQVTTARASTCVKPCLGKASDVDPGMNKNPGGLIPGEQTQEHTWVCVLVDGMIVESC